MSIASERRGNEGLRMFPALSPFSFFPSPDGSIQDIQLVSPIILVRDRFHQPEPVSIRVTNHRLPDTPWTFRRLLDNPSLRWFHRSQTVFQILHGQLNHDPVLHRLRMVGNMQHDRANIPLFSKMKTRHDLILEIFGKTQNVRIKIQGLLQRRDRNKNMIQLFYFVIFQFLTLPIPLFEKMILLPHAEKTA